MCSLVLAFYARGPSAGEAASLSEHYMACVDLTGLSPCPGAPLLHCLLVQLLPE